ncbi:MAG: type II toxin-antitoxin system RelE/ParE family toxin [Chthoniobacter sp.]
MRVIYHPDAERELVEAAAFYERRASSLGGAFLEAVDRAISGISKTPGRWRITETDIRRCPMRRFPYAIYYRALEDHVRILAFKHHKRHPNYWRYRIAQ